MAASTALSDGASADSTWALSLGQLVKPYSRASWYWESATDVADPVESSSAACFFRWRRSGFCGKERLARGGLGRHGDLLSWIAQLSACAGPKEGSLDVMTATMGLDPFRGPVTLADAGHKDIDSSRRGSSVPMMAGVSVLQALDRLRFHGYRETPSPATGLRSFVEQTRRLHL